jgi:hypothetical protein
MAEHTIFPLIPCRSCGRDISADASACPSCGGVNDWVHPSLAVVVAHLAGRDQECRVEARGHVLHAVAMHHNMRQSFGGLAMMGGMISLPVGFFFPPMLGLGILLLCIGGALTGFGLSAATRKELTLDLRDPGLVVGPCDRDYWSVPSLSCLHHRLNLIRASAFCKP